jgi:uncharacterized protein YbjT (DUF2867 family)
VSGQRIKPPDLKMRYCITGATGFIGGRIARQLIEAGHAVTALVRDPARARDLAGLGVALAAGDITAKDSLYPAGQTLAAFLQRRLPVIPRQTA